MIRNFFNPMLLLCMGLIGQEISAAEEPIEGAPALELDTSTLDNDVKTSEASEVAGESSNSDANQDTKESSKIDPAATDNSAKKEKDESEPVIVDVEKTTKKETSSNSDPVIVPEDSLNTEEESFVEDGAMEEENSANGEDAIAKELEVTENSSNKDDQNKPLQEEQPVDTLKKKTDDADLNLYSREYLSDMFLPYFYHTYEVPQNIDRYFTLMDLKLAENGPALVMDIGVNDSIGPMDLEGSTEDNSHLKSFCLIALRLGVLHKLDSIHVEFYHGLSNFYTRKLTYNFCTGKDPLIVGKQVLANENVRLDDEFVYAYQQQRNELLDTEYLKKQFAPYALDRISEQYDPLEKNPKMDVPNDSVLRVTFTVDSKKVSKVRESKFIKGRIRRTCSLLTYREWVLPRIKEMQYNYLMPNGTLVKSISVSKDTCGVLEDDFIQ